MGEDQFNISEKNWQWGETCKSCEDISFYGAVFVMSIQYNVVSKAIELLIQVNHSKIGLNLKTV